MRACRSNLQTALEDEAALAAMVRVADVRPLSRTRRILRCDGRAPDTATPDELRAYQLHITDTEVTPSV